MCRARGSLLAITCVAALGVSVAAHHGLLPLEGHSTGMHDAVMIAICLGVLAIATGTPAVPGLLRAGAVRPVRRLEAAELLLPTAGAYPTRAGPRLFVRLVVLRR
jgi:hypothetical protein